MFIQEDDLSDDRVIALVTGHLSQMKEVTPEESVHALGPGALRADDITVWTAWSDPGKKELMGCGALKEIDREHGEIKAMRTGESHLRRGIATALLRHMIKEAHRRSYARLSLETGSTSHFAPARALYARFGFNECGPFEGYTEDPHSTFMTLTRLDQDSTEDQKKL